MLFTHWLRRHRSSPSRHRLSQSFRPVLQALEDRLVPSAVKATALLSSAATDPATHLRVVVPQSVQAGSSFSVIVEADTASNRLATSYTGTVHLSLGTSDAGASVPADYTFTSADHGVHRFSVTLAATGSQTITAADTVTATITGSATTTVLAAPVATQLLVISQSQAAVGVASGVTVKVLDASGHVIPNYTGTITLSSSDSLATGAINRSATAAALPITYTFTAADHGQHTFQVTFLTGDASGTPTTVTATDTTGALVGSASLTVYPATTVTHFGIAVGGTAGMGTAKAAAAKSIAAGCGGGAATATLGSPVAVTVVALNAANQVVTGYTGTISLSSSDAAALVSAASGGITSTLAAFSYAFTSSDNGSHTFYLTFGTAGQQTLTATDAASAAVLGTVNVRVKGS